MEDVVTERGGFLPTVAGALTFRDEVYRAAAEQPQPVRRGLVFIVTIGVITALAAVVGAALSTWTSPNMAALKTTIIDGVMSMPWTKELTPEQLAEAQRNMTQVMDTVWQIIGAVVPNVPAALVGVITQPVSMILFWLVFGAVAHLFARLLAGHGTLAQTYGATALAAAPALLGVVKVIPTVQAAGLTTWALICTYLALKHAHGLTPGRAFWATVLPMVVFGLFVMLVAGSVAAVIAAAVSAGGLGQ
jgi:hypothetical protein